MKITWWYSSWLGWLGSKFWIHFNSFRMIWIQQRNLQWIIFFKQTMPRYKRLHIIIWNWKARTLGQRYSFHWHEPSMPTILMSSEVWRLETIRKKTLLTFKRLCNMSKWWHWQHVLKLLIIPHYFKMTSLTEQIQDEAKRRLTRNLVKPLQFSPVISWSPGLPESSPTALITHIWANCFQQPSTIWSMVNSSRLSKISKWRISNHYWNQSHRPIMITSMLKITFNPILPKLTIKLPVWSLLAAEVLASFSIWIWRIRDVSSTSEPI